MSDQGQRIEFGDSGPYLFQEIDVQPEGMLLEDHAVCLLRFEGLYLPVALAACAPMAEALTQMEQTAMGPEREGMIPLEFDLSETLELPLLTSVAGESFQHGETVYLDVFFDQTRARLCFSILTAAAVGQILSQLPKQE
ncbi:hypothetical protein [Pseudodesulfovibrio indicus]|uniref:Uncharacterized protein n=1 Tax=Pseudodesulfovibrio indicus TaxID=1716143 RepID=A0A126QSK4_9BACT|nr:hypothetical protein [Pseudodesulfovibrio indicus]AMK12726.1 hypothetical protein AWY79_17255 [Pseudodesulfovibrio indicus]TDT86792.1 hypothetical protein EDC59_111110 [Pseudodesulfovibrio indicus]